MSARVAVCGARDTQHFRAKAISIFRGVGLDASDYTSPAASPISDNHANNFDSSRTMIERADLVVFVVKESYGQITWQYEIVTAKEKDVPVLFLLHEEIFGAVRFLATQGITHTAVTDPQMSALVRAIANISADPHQRLISYNDENFERVIRDALGGIIDQLLVDRGELKRSLTKISLLSDSLDRARDRSERLEVEEASLSQRVTSLSSEILLLQEALTDRDLTINNLENSAENPALTVMKDSRPLRTFGALAAISLLLVGLALGWKLGGMAAPAAVTAPTRPSPTKSSTKASSVTLDPGLSCKSAGWVTYYGLTEPSDAPSTALAIRKDILSDPNWSSNDSIHVSDAQTMCSTGFAIAYAVVPIGRLVVWSDPVSTREAAIRRCAVPREMGHDCFVAQNPSRVQPSGE